MEIINGYNSNNRIEYYDRFSINLSLCNMGNMEGVSTMKEYNGHRSWNAWNVALWLSNEYDLYQEIVDRVKNCTNQNIAHLIANEPTIIKLIF